MVAMYAHAQSIWVTRYLCRQAILTEVAGDLGVAAAYDRHLHFPA